ncbi:hypothetical protein N7492_005427 [Penicillium capsulatum]|uniref:Low temperature requirement A n=1 Tax=Penicillium capsulatum TaxID=69766 RepID=A0A9W9IBJ6_9EURO|nr:hypothetical protein N7492_005427 [Penicillium capsulatum]
MKVNSKSTNSEYSIAAQDEKITDTPEFQHYEETSNLQLFYDLFFVANLTSFTNAHEINSTHKLASYIGFFCILWFSWAQVTLYDVRFATDSFIERVAHACHFGAMVGFAIVGPQFMLEHNGWGALQQLSVVLAVDRFVLACQYASTLTFTWKHRSTRAPMIIIIASLIIAMAIYLGVSFAYFRHEHYHAYIAWYIIAVLEVGVNLGVAAGWEAMSFKKTQIVERMSCLTLIILGEGIIGLTRTIVKVENFDATFTAADIGGIISAVMLLYFVYQLYFDNLRRDHFGPIRQQAWSMCHFPFHVSLALMMEGINQMILTPHIHRDFTRLFDQVSGSRGVEGFGAADVAHKLNDTAHYVFEHFPFTVETYVEVSEDIKELSHLSGGHGKHEEIVSKAVTVFISLMKTCAEGFGFEAPEEMEVKTWSDVLKWSDSIDELSNLSFGKLPR